MSSGTEVASVTVRICSSRCRIRCASTDFTTAHGLFSGPAEPGLVQDPADLCGCTGWVGYGAYGRPGHHDAGAGIDGPTSSLGPYATGNGDGAEQPEFSNRRQISQGSTAVLLIQPGVHADDVCPNAAT